MVVSLSHAQQSCCRPKCCLCCTVCGASVYSTKPPIHVLSGPCVHVHVVQSSSISLSPSLPAVTCYEQHSAYSYHRGHVKLDVTAACLYNEMSRIIMHSSRYSLTSYANNSIPRTLYQGSPRVPLLKVGVSKGQFSRSSRDFLCLT